MEAELNTKEGVIIADQAAWAEKLKALIRGGIHNFQLIWDFDQTLTRAKVNGESAQSTFCVLHGCDFVTKEFTQRGYENWQHYRHIESDPDMTHEVKVKHMEEWWAADMSDIATQKLTADNFSTMIRKSRVYFRHGMSQLIQLKQDYKFPLLVVSAGIGNVINSAFELFLAELDTKLSNLAPLSLVSNMGVFNENDILVDFKEPRVNIMNKDQCVDHYLKQMGNSEEAKDAAPKPNLIMMGDVVEDTRMINKVTYDTCLKIGYLNCPEKQKDQAYAKRFWEAYDIVITNDGNLDIVSALISLIADQKPEMDLLDTKIVDLTLVASQ